MATQVPGSIYSPGLVLQGRYRLDEALASGGMAEVWRAHDLVLQRSVAVKVLHPHLASDPKVIERFRREAIAAARLAHPHIVPTYDTGTDGNTTFIVMGLISGPTLAYAAQATPLSQRQAVSIIRQVAGAVHYAHRAGIIHRDIKPGNILVIDDDYRVMVTDFGIAKAVTESYDDSLTMPGFVLGTPAYLAPEQAEGGEADARSDVYAVGVVFHELLCGHISTDAPTQLSASVNGEIPAAALCPDLPPSLAAIVAKATAVDPADRYQSAAELHHVLEEYETSLGLGDAARVAQPHKVRIAPPKTPRADQRRATESAGTEDTAEHAVFVAADPNPTMATPAAAPQQAAPARPASSYEIEPARNERRRRIALIIVVVALVLAAVAAGRALSVMGSGDDAAPAVVPEPPATTTFAGATSFDPLGDGAENANAVAAVLDGNASTTWSTERYNSRTFGNLKSGVGLVLTLPSAQTFSKLNVATTSTGWSAAVYVANGPQTSLDAWGTAVDTQSGLGNSATFDLHQQQGTAVLIWFTDLGDANRVTVADVQLGQ